MPSGLIWFTKTCRSKWCVLATGEWPMTLIIFLYSSSLGEVSLNIRIKQSSFSDAWSRALPTEEAWRQDLIFSSESASVDAYPKVQCISIWFLFSSYFIERGICFLGLCEKNFSKRLAFAYLEDLAGEFIQQFGSKVDTVSRPYSFIEFGETHALFYLVQWAELWNTLFSAQQDVYPFCIDTLLNSFWSDNYMQKAKKSYMDSRARRNLNAINNELQEVQRIMVQNIDDVLLRGDALTSMSWLIMLNSLNFTIFNCLIFLPDLDDKASNLAAMSQKYKKDAHYLNLKSSYAKIAAIIVIVIIFLLFVRYWVFWNFVDVVQILCMNSETASYVFLCAVPFAITSTKFTFLCFWSLSMAWGTYKTYIKPVHPHPLIFGIHSICVLSV